MIPNLLQKYNIDNKKDKNLGIKTVTPTPDKPLASGIPNLMDKYNITSKTTPMETTQSIPLKYTTPTLPTKKQEFLSQGKIDTRKEDTVLSRVGRIILPHFLEKELGIAPEQRKTTLTQAQIVKEQGNQATIQIAKKNPNEISPSEYLKRGISFGNELDPTNSLKGYKNDVSVSDLPEPVNLKQKMAQAIGSILTMSLAQPLIESAFTSIIGSTVRGAKILDTVSTASKLNPWTVGYGVDIAKAGAEGGLFGLITKNKQSVARNVLETAGIFAAFSAIAFPIQQFFKPIIENVGSIKGVNPKAKSILNDPAITQQPISKTIWFKNPKNPNELLKVTGNGLEYISSKGAEVVEKGVYVKDIPALTSVDIEAFKVKPSVYENLKKWIGGKITSGKVDFKVGDIVPVNKTKIDPNIIETTATESYSKAMSNISDLKPSEVRDSYFKLDNKLNNLLLDNTSRVTLIADLNARQDALNTYNNSNKEVVLDVPKTGSAISLANIEIVKYDDGKYTMSYDTQLSNSGIGSPFSSKLYNTKNEAINAGRTEIKKFIEKEKKGATSAILNQIKQIENKLNSLNENKMSPEVENSNIKKELSVKFTFDNNNELNETARALKSWRNDVAKGTSKNDAYTKIEGSYGKVIRLNIEDFNKSKEITKPKEKIKINELNTDKEGKVKTIDIIEKLFEKVKKEDKSLVRIAIDTVDSVNQDTVTIDKAINSVKNAGYINIARYLDFLDRGQYKIKLKSKNKNISEKKGVKNTIDKNKIAKLETELKDAYKKYPDSEKKLETILVEMELAEAGKRLFTGYGLDREVTGIASTFPQWIPEKVRTTKSIDALREVIKDVNTLTYPSKVNATAKRLLVNEMLNELDSRLGIDTSEIRKDIIKQYGKIGKIEKSNNSNVGRGEQGRGNPTKERAKIEGVKQKEIQDRINSLKLEIKNKEDFSGSLTKEQIKERQTELNKIENKVIGQPIFSGKEVLDKMRYNNISITPSIKTEIRKQNFELKTISIDNILKNDPDAKEFVDSFKGKSVRNEEPIIIGKWQGKYNSVMDGYHRLGALKNSGVTEIKVYVSKETKIFKKNGTLNFDTKGSPEMNKKQLIKSGFGIEAMGYGEYADIETIGGKPVVAYRVSNDRPYPIMGLSVQKDFRGKGIATQFVIESARDGIIYNQSPNKDMLRILNKIGKVSKPNEEDIVIVTIKPKKEIKISNSSGFASIDKFRETMKPIENNIEKVNPIEFPELVKLARQLTGEFPKVKLPRFRPSFGGRPYGIFYPRGNGKIVLNTELFTVGNEEQLSKTLAHEIGHLIDYLPDKTMARGNILGRLAVLKKFMKDFYPSIGITRSNKDIKNELWQLSKYWRPLGRSENLVSDSYLEYRKSPPEIYADFISVLFNDPKLAQEKAPTAYNVFFKRLDKKPEVKSAYFELQDLLAGTSEDLMKARQEDIRKGFERGEDLQAEFSAKRKLARSNFWEKLRQQLDDINYPIIKKQRLAEANGKVFSEEDNPRFILQEQSLADNENFLFVDSIDKEIVKPLEKAGVIIEDMGEYLLLDRIVNERQNIANPFGFNTKNAPKQMEYLKKHLGENNFNLLEAKVAEFHNMVFKSVEEAVRVGSYNKELFDTKIKPNKDHYASFQVVDYMQDYMPATVKGQTGTLKEVANPFVSTILKTISLNRLNAYQRAKNATIKLLKGGGESDIVKSKTITTDGKLKIFKVGKDKGGLEVLEDGKIVSYDVDPYIAESFKRDKIGDLNLIVGLLDKFNNKLFKPLVTTYNLGFAVAFNPIRDIKRNYKLIPNANFIPIVVNKKGIKIDTVGNLLGTYVKNLPSAIRYAKGELDDFTRSLVESKAISAPINEYNFDPREDELGNILKKYGLVKEYKPLNSKTIEIIRKKILKPVAQVLEGIRFIANTLEVVSKISGARIRIASGETGKQLSHNIRNFTGTPNWKVKGKNTRTTNAIFVFSNIMKEGIKADFQFATNPNTRAGYWWKTVKIDLLPKFLMFLAGAGALGIEAKKFYDKVSEYDKSNYLIVPLGETEKGKAIYMRIPHDENGRLISAIFWKMANFIKDKGKASELQDIFAVGAGQLPSVTPAITILGGWTQYLSGRNPYDSFRGRSVIDDTTWRAGGGAAMKKMVKWTTNTLGVSSFATYDTHKNTGVETFMRIVPPFNRLIRISNYGETEKLNKIKNEVGQQRAKDLLKERDILSKYTQQATKDNKSSILYLTKYGNKAVKEVLGGHMPRNADERAISKRIINKFKLLMKKEVNNDPRVLSLISATSSAEKTAILKDIKSNMSNYNWNKLRALLLKDKIVNTKIMNGIR